MFAQKVEKLMLGLLGVVCPIFILNLVAQKGVAYKKKSQIATNCDSPPPPPPASVTFGTSSDLPIYKGLSIYLAPNWKA